MESRLIYLDRLPQELIYQFLILLSPTDFKSFISSFKEYNFDYSNLIRLKYYSNRDYLDFIFNEFKIINFNNYLIIISTIDLIKKLREEDKITMTKLYNSTKLSVTDIELNFLPNEIEHLNNLNELDLRSNQLNNLPKEIGSLVNLKSLNLRYNKLTYLPKEIDNLTNLKYLDLESNMLTILPKEMGNLVNLEQLLLSYNLLYNLPEEIGNLTNLEQLNLGDNPLTMDQVPLILRTIVSMKKRLCSNPSEITGCFSILYETKQ